MYEKAKQDDKCGLCGKTNQEALIANGKELTKSKCCSNWVYKYLIKLSLRSL